MEDEYLTRCVVDTSRRTVYIYSNEGDKKTVECDTPEEFMIFKDIMLQFLVKNFDKYIEFTEKYIDLDNNYHDNWKFCNGRDFQTILQTKICV